MKYIREVSPLFKKPSLVADLPWDGVRPQSPSYSGSDDSGSPKHGGSSSPKDRKVISLKMCFISRNLTMPDLENRYRCSPCFPFFFPPSVKPLLERNICSAEYNGLGKVLFPVFNVFLPKKNVKDNKVRQLSGGYQGWKQLTAAPQTLSV